MGIKLDYEKVGLGTMVFIYQFEAHPKYGEIANDIFDRIERKNKGSNEHYNGCRNLNQAHERR